MVSRSSFFPNWKLSMEYFITVWLHRNRPNSSSAIAQPQLMSTCFPISRESRPIPKHYITLSATTLFSRSTMSVWWTCTLSRWRMIKMPFWRQTSSFKTKDWLWRCRIRAAASPSERLQVWSGSLLVWSLVEMDIEEEDEEGTEEGMYSMCFVYRFFMGRENGRRASWEE